MTAVTMTVIQVSKARNALYAGYTFTTQTGRKGAIHQNSLN